ncbi:MAG TPA: DUF3450 family protein [Fibrobacteraceae bacterium]|nr:DUF3450 family protein [Fibrobacteraceae bacterium]
MPYLWILCFVVITSVWAQESLPEIRRQIKAVESETAHENELRQSEKQRHQDFLENARRKLDSYASQSKTLQSQIDSLHQELGRLDEARKQATETSHWAESRRAKYQESLAYSIEKLAPVVESDIPFKREEMAQSLRETASQLRKGLISPDEALGRSFDVLQDRIQMGYTTETWSGYLAWQGRNLSGKFVRYGGVAAIFVSQDGQEVFWLHKLLAGYDWQAATDPLLANSLRETLRVAEGKAPPMLVFLPFPGQEKGGAQ